MFDDYEAALVLALHREIGVLQEKLTAADARIRNLIQAVELLNRQLAEAKGWIAEYGKGD